MDLAAATAANGADPTAPSLANLLRLHRPLVIVDEAHNARTHLSFDTLARFNPSCILEFTATPDQDPKGDPSNVLTHVSAVDLKTADMIKLPIRLKAREQWKEAVQERGMALEQLVAHRFRLRDAAREKVASCRKAANLQAFQHMLLAGAALYDNYEKALRHEGVDIVSVCTPQHLHAENTLAANVSSRTRSRTATLRTRSTRTRWSSRRCGATKRVSP